MISKGRVLRAFAAGFCLALASIASADIITTGDAGADGTSYYVGRNADGTLRVDLGSSLNSSYSYLGYSLDCTGSAIVTDPNSLWQTGQLYVGRSGTGSMSVEAGGRVYSSIARVGYDTGSIGSIHVTGTGSSWTTSSAVTVGYGGSGQIVVEAGGQGQVGAFSNSYLGYTAGSSGEILVTGTGSSWLNDGHGYIGYSGSGAVHVAAGGYLSGGYSLGHNVGSTGTIVVTEIGSTWDYSPAPSYIGNSGNGVLRIEDGASASGAITYLGYGEGSSGDIFVTGTGSSLTTGDLYVGFLGSGSLTVGDGGSVTATTLYGSLNNLLGNGTVFASSGILDADLAFDATHGLAQSLAFGSGGVLNLTLNATKPLGIGYRDSGSLRITDGLSVSSITGYLGYQPRSVGAAVVSGTGSKWSTGGFALYVGKAGTGALRIEAGGQVSDAVGGIGYEVGGLGAVTVTGAGSAWINSSSIFVGYFGTGALDILDGARVSSSSATLGSYSGSRGAVRVTGPDATLLINTNLYVGSAGTGSLTVRDGGKVSATTLYASIGDLYGDGKIDCRGAVLDADVTFDSAHGLIQSILFGSGGTLNLNIDGTGSLGVGHLGHGSLRIAGVTVTSAGGYLGHRPGSSGTATVTGTGSKWANGSNFFIGAFGNGTLNVEAGGQVSSTYGYLGYNTGASGTAIITGTGSAWTMSRLYVGHYGMGVLRIEAGAQASSSDGYLGYSSGSIGLAVVTGTGTRLDTNGAFYVGQYGDGSLSVEAGGKVSSYYGYLGYKTASTGSAKISGKGSEWWLVSSNLYVGSSGSGTLSVEAGGQVSAVYGYVGQSSGSTGLVTVMGSGSKWANSSNLEVGGAGSGVLDITAGGQVNNSLGYLGSYAGSVGAARVAGTGSMWANASLYVGYYGCGSLTIEAGGQVTDSYGYMAYKAGSTAASKTAGTGSKWINKYDLYVGYSGTGSLSVDAGGQVTNSRGYLGYSAGSSGTATVAGAGSIWANGSQLYIGASGTGTLIVADHGQVVARSASINSGSSLKLHVSGSGMLDLGDASTVGTFTNDGVVALYGDAFLPAGVYKPISEYAGRAMTWSGTGSVSAFGGAWDNTAKTFSVADPTALLAEDVDTLTTGKRLVITDPATGRRVGASFGIIPDGATFAADAMAEADLSALAAMPEFTGDLLAGWGFQTSLAGSEVMLSFDLGTGLAGDMLAIWHLHDGQWARYTPKLQTYDEHGILSLTVTEFSGYAVAVPEPSSLLLLFAAATICMRRKKD